MPTLQTILCLMYLGQIFLQSKNNYLRNYFGSCLFLTQIFIRDSIRTIREETFTRPLKNQPFVYFRLYTPDSLHISHIRITLTYLVIRYTIYNSRITRPVIGKFTQHYLFTAIARQKFHEKVIGIYDEALSTVQGRLLDATMIYKKCSSHFCN